MATIALVDDDRNILASVSILLEQEGYHVRTLADGAAASPSSSLPSPCVAPKRLPRTASSPPGAALTRYSTSTAWRPA